MPSIWYKVSLHVTGADAWNYHGYSFAGLPGIIIRSVFPAAALNPQRPVGHCPTATARRTRSGCWSGILRTNGEANFQPRTGGCCRSLDVLHRADFRVNEPFAALRRYARAVGAGHL